MEIELKQNERLDDLECKSLFVIQNKTGYCFNSDSVFLANSVKAHATDTIVDLGTGSGVIALLLSAKTKAKKIYGVEIQAELADMAKRSVRLNGLEKRIDIRCMDMVLAPKAFGLESADVVVSNPPYFEWKGGEADSKSICRSEVTVTLDIVAETAAALLKFGGRFYMICKVERLVDALCAMRKQKIEPKTVRFVVPKPGRAPDTFIVEGRKCGQSGFKLLPDLTVRTADGELTEEARRMYGNE